MFPPADATPRRRHRKPSKTKARLTTALTVVITAAVIGGGTWALRNPQPILDQVAVWQYSPPPAIAAHAARLGLTDHGRFLYYASNPTISDAARFAGECPSQEGDFGILGCYVPADKAIYLFDVTDPRLDGTEEVTAAHEMLHAAWDRLGQDERDRLEPLLLAEAEKLADDPEFVDRMAFYERTEPGQNANELHSIIGTEVADIGEELETYYRAYFTDRSIVTGLHTVANAVFVQLKSDTAALVRELDELKVSIEADYRSYTSGIETLNADIQVFNARADSGGYSSQAAFDRDRAALVARNLALESLYASISQRRDRFESRLRDLEALNALAAELQQGLNIGEKAAANL